MQSISLCDTLTIDPADGIVFRGSEDNLIPRAARALNAFAGTDHGANIRLIKRIPARAGLGGGSADAAATLVALDQFWRLHLPLDALHQIALSLGADVPFCLGGTPMRARHWGGA